MVWFNSLSRLSLKINHGWNYDLLHVYLFCVNFRIEVSSLYLTQQEKNLLQNL